MRFTVNQFIIVPTATYNPPAQRNYEIDSRNSANIENVTAEITRGGQDLTYTTMSRLASDILVPSHAHGEVYIPNSFSNKRFRFMMELKHEDGSIQYLVGYTDRLEETRGFLPPDLQLHFNLSFNVRQHRDRGAHGAKTITSVTDVAQILTAPNMSTQQAMGGISAPGDSAVTLRPSDIFTVSEASIAADHLRDLARNQGDGPGLGNIKVTSSEAEFKHGIRKSATTNQSASRYLSSTIGAYVAAEASDNQDAFFTPYDEAVTQLREPMTSNDPFFNEFGIIGKKLSQGGMVTWGEIERVAPEISRMASDCINRTRRAQVIDGRNGAYHTANTPEGIAMTKITNGLYSIMSGNLVTTLTIFGRSGMPMGLGIQNHDPHVAHTNNAVVEVLNFRSFNSNPHPHLRLSIAKAFLYEVLSDISRNFTREVVVQATFDLLGDTQISISLDGRPPVDYTNPSWCSALSSPILAPSQQVLQDLTNDFKKVFKGVGQRNY